MTLIWRYELCSLFKMRLWLKCRTAIKVLFLFLNLCLSVKLDSHSVSCTSISFLINPLQKMFLRFFFVIYRLLKRDKSCQLMLLEYRTITEKGNSHFSVEAKMLPPPPLFFKAKMHRHYGCTMCTPLGLENLQKNVISWSEKRVKHIVLVYNAHPSCKIKNWCKI